MYSAEGEQSRSSDSKSSSSSSSWSSSRGGVQEEFKRQARALIDGCKQELTQNKLPQTVARLHFEIAHAYDTMLASPRQALTHYRKSLEYGPEYLPSIRNARRLLILSRNYEEAIALFDTEIRLSGRPRTKALLYLEKGRVLEDLMKEQRKALECYSKGIELDPDNPSLLGARGQVELNKQDWTALEKTLKKTANAAGDKRHRAALVIERAQIAETRLENAVLAAELYKSAVTANPQASGAFPSLKRLLYIQNRWKDLIEVLEGEIATTSDKHFQCAAFLTIGRVYADYLGQRDQAIEALSLGTELMPENTAIWEALALQQETKGDVKALVEVLQKCAERFSNPQEKLGMLHRIGSLFEIELADRESAIKWYQAALVLSPTYLPALQSLERLYADGQKWDQLISMYLAEAAAVDDAIRSANAYGKVADIFETKTRNSEQAIKYYALALKCVPEIEGAFRALSSLYERAGRYEELVELLESAVARTKQEDRAYHFLTRIGSIFENQLRDHDRAAHAYRRILKLNPQHLGALHALQRTLEASGRYKELVLALETEIEITTDDKQKIALMLRVGEIYEDKISNLEEALTCYRKVLELDNTYPPVLASLGRLYSGLERWDDLIDIYETELEGTALTPAKVVLVHKMGEVCEFRLGDEERARGCYRRAIELDSTFEPSTVALVKRLRELGDWDGLVEVLENQLKGARDLTTKVKVATELGEIEEIQRKDLIAASQAFKKAVDLDPNHRPALEGYYRVVSQIADWNDLVQCLMRESSNVGDEHRTIDALLRAAEVFATYLDNSKMAITVYETIVDKQPANLSALLALESIYRETGSWKQLADVLRQIADVVEDEDSKVGALLELARLLENRRLTKHEELVNTYRKILEIDPVHVIAQAGLERIAILTNNRDLLEEADKHFIETERDPTLSAVYNTRYGISVEGRNLFDSIAAYRQALSLDSRSLSAIYGLKRLAEIVNDPRTMTIALKYESDWTTDDEAAADILLQKAYIEINRLHDQSAAIEDASLALERCPDHADAGKLLTELLLENNQVDELIVALKRAADGCKDEDRRAMLLGSVARLYVDVKNDVPAAISTLLELELTTVDDVPYMMQLSACYRQNANWPEAIALMEKTIALSADSAILVETYFELAELGSVHFEDQRRTRNYLLALLKMEPNHRQGLALLVDVYLKEGNLKEAEQKAQQLLQISNETSEREEAFVFLGCIEREKGQNEKAGRYFGQAVALTGPTGKGAEAYRGLLATKESWSNFERALGEYQDSKVRDPRKHPQILDVILERADIQTEKLGRLGDAVETLKKGLALTDGESALRYKLGEGLVNLERYDEAIREYQILLHEDPSRAEAWQALGDIFLLRGLKGEAAVAFGPLNALGAADSRRRKLAQEMGYQTEKIRPGILRRSELGKLGGGVQGDQLIVNLFDSMAEAMTRLYPAELERYGGASRILPVEQFDRNFQLFCARLAEIFDVEHSEIYVTDGERADIEFEFSLPISIYIPAYVSQQPKAEQVFTLAKVFATIATGMHPVFKLGVDECAMLVEAAAYRYSADYHPYRFAEEQVEDLGRKLFKATPRRARRALEEAALLYARGPRADVADCAAEAELISLRAAVLVAGDIEAAIEVIRRSNHELSLYEGRELVNNSPHVVELLRYWISEEASAFRSKMVMG